ncbi:branched-chain amino acid transport system II carrier protein [Fusobacterium sp.]|uniref:branched-chain amino acid transport system II carrier protein n=1 Tax=Fusobacterium sp. TaxID=68766 RepID=UPI00396CB4F3
MDIKVLKKGIIVGFALFATFFGAGNLIFPPKIGLLSGASWEMGLLGLFCSGILLPVIAVIAVNNSGGDVRDILDPVAPWFYNMFYLIMVLMIAMTSTMPKLAATTYEMGITALTDKVPMSLSIVVFFIVIYFLARDPNSVVEKMGKYLTPILLIALLIIVVKGVLSPLGTPVPTGIKKPFLDALMTGYNTGDLTLGLMCASLFFNALKDGSIPQNKVKQGIYITALVAIVGLTVIYGGLLYMGATGHEFITPDMSMATSVIILVEQLLGKVGSGILAIIVILACLTTGVGIATIAGEFVQEISKGKIKYKAWIIVVCIIGIGLGILGVNKIVGYASFMFAVIYPICIVLTFLGLIKPLLSNDGPFKGGVLLAAIFSIMETVTNLGIKMGFVETLLKAMPLSEYGFSWLVPSIVGMVVGWFIMNKKK